MILNFNKDNWLRKQTINVDYKLRKCKLFMKHFSEHEYLIRATWDNLSLRSKKRELTIDCAVRLSVLLVHRLRILLTTDPFSIHGRILSKETSLPTVEASKEDASYVLMKAPWNRKSVKWKVVTPDRTSGSEILHYIVFQSFQFRTKSLLKR